MAGNRSDKGVGRFGSDDGAIAVIVGICLFAMVGAAAIAIDLGSGWAAKRDLVTDLDAAALAGAQRLAHELASNPSQCPAGGAATPTLRSRVQQSVDTLLTANGGRAEDVTVEIGCSRRTVRVAGTQPGQTVLAPALGVDEIRAGGYGMAKAVPGAAGGAFIPLTLCAKQADFADWLEDGRPTAQGSVEILFADSALVCPGVPGNWGWIGDTSNATLAGWINGGMPANTAVTLYEEGADPPVERCVIGGYSGDWCNGGPGVKNALTDLGARYAGTGEVVTLLVHGRGNSGGATARYRPDGFLDVIIHAVRRNPASSASITVEFVGFRDASDVAAGAGRSFLCSADGAPPGDPGCD